MTKPILKQKALLVIEAIAEHGFFENGDEVENYKKTLELIYMYAHVGTEPSCLHIHQNWIDDLNKTYKKMKKERLI